VKGSPRLQQGAGGAEDDIVSACGWTALVVVCAESGIVSACGWTALVVVCAESGIVSACG